MSITPYHQGYNAKRAGRPVTSNPYKSCSEPWYRFVKGYTDETPTEKIDAGTEDQPL